MKQLYSFFYDTEGRVPFSILGILIILGSSCTTIYVIRLETQQSLDLATSQQYTDITLLLESAEADIATALNIAGISALQEIGRTPVITTSLGSAEYINQYRAKEIIRDELTIYLAGQYQENEFHNDHYAINVIFYNNTPIPSVQNISISIIEMNLTRFTVPFLGPANHRQYPTYWNITVPLNIEIQSLIDRQSPIILKKSITVSCLITSRYPLLEQLVNEYQQMINGSFSPLWMFSTGMINLYSMIRGLKHYRMGLPSNIVDNSHLALIINSGVLLEQSLVFNSVDPLALVDLASQIKKSYKQSPGSSLEIFNNEMNTTSYSISTHNLSQGTANLDAGDDFNRTMNDSPMLNMSDIAAHILYNFTGVTLHFENEEGGTAEEFLSYDDEFESHLQECLSRWMNQSYYVTNVNHHREINRTTLQTLHQILSTIYQDELYTIVHNRTIVAEIPGEPGDGWTNGGVGSWIYREIIPGLKHEIKPDKGLVQPESALYEEFYNVTYQRDHYWWRMEWDNTSSNHTLVQRWNNVTDTKIESVTLQVVLSQYALYNETKNDVNDILYYNETLDDLNLEDTPTVYIDKYPDTNELKQTLLITQNNIGTRDLQINISGYFSPTLDEESWQAIHEIYQNITNITVDEDINITNYPNPFILLQKTYDNLEIQVRENIFSYLDLLHYQGGTNFKSVGKKAVYYTRQWYITIVQQNLMNVFSDLSNEIENMIDQILPLNADFNTHDISESLDATADALRNQFTIPFGTEINLTRYNTEGDNLWNETIRLAVSQDPHYLDPNKKVHTEDEEFWPLKIRNRCIFGPTGMPLLPPTPVTPWVATINTWIVDVEGEFSYLKIIDTTDETSFNPLLGQEALSYIREANIISVGDTILGENTRISFGFTTIAFSLVPPWGMMVGDVQPNWFDDHTPGFDD